MVLKAPSPVPPLSASTPLTRSAVPQANPPCPVTPPSVLTYPINRQSNPPRVYDMFKSTKMVAIPSTISIPLSVSIPSARPATAHSHESNDDRLEALSVRTVHTLFQKLKHILDDLG